MVAVGRQNREMGLKKPTLFFFFFCFLKMLIALGKKFDAMAFIMPSHRQDRSIQADRGVIARVR